MESKKGESEAELKVESEKRNGVSEKKRKTVVWWLRYSLVLRAVILTV